MSVTRKYHKQEGWHYQAYATAFHAKQN